MTYTKIQFGYDLKNLIDRFQCASTIGNKIFPLFFDNTENFEEGLDDIMTRLFIME